MVNYGNGKIYKIESHSGDKIYIGSTTKEYLSQRMDNHRGDYKRWKAGIISKKTRSFELFDEYGADSCKITLLESYPCNSRDELTSREAHFIRTLECVNKAIPGRTDKEYYIDNKDYITRKHKEYSEANKEKLSRYYKEYRDNNKDKIKDYYESNKEYYSEQYKETINCGCGSVHRVKDRARHQKTIKHKTYLESLESNQ